MCVQSAVDPRKRAAPFPGECWGCFTVEVIFEPGLEGGEGIPRKKPQGQSIHRQYSAVINSEDSGARMPSAHLASTVSVCDLKQVN